MGTATVVVGTVLAIVILNACMTVLVARNASLLKQHKLVQCCLIWLLPVVGTVVAALFLRSIREAPPHRSSLHVPNGEDYPAVNLDPPVADP